MVIHAATAGLVMTMLPNTALEPTAITPVRLRFGHRLADDFRRRGSALMRVVK